MSSGEENIKYSLESCSSNSFEACRNCSYNQFNARRCVQMLMSDTLELIKQKDEEIYHLRMDIILQEEAMKHEKE